MKRPNGNDLDREVCKYIKGLAEDKFYFFQELDKVKKSLENYQDDFEQKIYNLNREENEKKIKVLVDALSNADESAASFYINSQINELEYIRRQITDLKSLMKGQEVTDAEFNILKENLKIFSSAFETINVEQKRLALRSLVQCIVWDGENVHVFLSEAKNE